VYSGDTILDGNLVHVENQAMVTVVITGARGQLGQELVNICPIDVDLITFSHKELDITATKSLNELLTSMKPDVIINTASYTNVDLAESNSDLAFQINASAVAELASIAKKIHARLIQLSTDYIFDGQQLTPYKPSDTPNPINVYGQSKWLGEQLALTNNPENTLIIRTSWLYSTYQKNFVIKILQQLKSADDLNIVADQIGAPTWAHQLAKVIWATINNPKLTGTLHWSDAGHCSWYEFALSIHQQALKLGFIKSAKNLKPILSESLTAPATRPAYSVLDTQETTKILGIMPIHWQENLMQMLRISNKHLK